MERLCHKTVLVALRGAHGFAPAPRRSLALLDSAEHFAIEMLCFRASPPPPAVKDLFNTILEQIRQKKSAEPLPSLLSAKQD